MERYLRFIYMQTGAMVLTVLGLTTLNALTGVTFILISFIFLLIISEFTAPITVTPAWRIRLRWVILGSLFVFAYVTVRHIRAIAPTI